MKALLCFSFAVSLLALGCGDDDPPGPVPTEDGTATTAGETHGGDSTTEPDTTLADSTGADATEDVPDDLPTSGPRAYVIGENDTADLEPGDMAGARVGDVVIMNDHIRFVIRSGEHALYMAGVGGGAIIDGGSPTADRIQEIVPIAGFGSFGKDATVEVVSNGKDGTAVVRTTASALVPPLITANVPGLTIEGTISQTYTVRAGERALEMTLALDGVESPQLVGDVLFVGGELKTLFRESDGWMLSEGPDVSYGLVAQETFSVLDFGGITAILGPTLDPPVEWTRWLVVGDGSASSLLDQILELRMTPYGSVAGTVDDPTASVTVYDADDIFVNRFRPDSDGAFGGRLPPGSYTLVAEGEGRFPGAPLAIEVEDEGELKDLAVSAEPTSYLEIDVDTPTRITISGGGPDGTRPVAPGKTTLAVRHGTLTITATRGFEWEHDQTTLEVGSGETVSWAPQLERVVDTAGWIAADFHLHSEWSPDSDVPLRRRVMACAAEGVEYAVATDHDVVTDYTPFILDSLEPFIRVQIGTEVSTATLGHINVFPVEMDLDLTGRGAIPWHGLEVEDLFETLSAGPDNRVVQINHGRSKSGSATFDAIDMDPADLSEQVLGLQFNAMEVFNGGGSGFDELLADWLALRQASKPVAATGVSDSHSIGALCGHARTMVRVDDSNLGTLDTNAVQAAIRAGDTMATSGPFITVEAAGEGTVHVRIQAPSYMPVNRVQLYADGQLDALVEIPEGETVSVVRLDEDVTLLNAGAKWVVGVVIADTIPEPMLKRKIRAISAPLTLAD